MLEEITVTAQKREQSIQDVGIAMSAFSGDQLAQMGWTNAQQVTAMVPGVQTIQPNGQAEGEKVLEQSARGAIQRRGSVTGHAPRYHPGGISASAIGTLKGSHQMITHRYGTFGGSWNV